MQVLSWTLLLALFVSVCHVQGTPASSCVGFAGTFCQSPLQDFTDFPYLEPGGANPCADNVRSQRCNNNPGKWCALYLKAYCHVMGGESGCLAYYAGSC